MKWIEVFLKTGIWLTPLTYYFIERSGYFTDTNVIGKVAVSFIPFILAMSEYTSQYRGDGGKKKAQHPPVTKSLKFKQPVGYPLGKIANDYICFEYDCPSNHNLLITGSSGTGKSSTCIINAILDSKRDFLMGRDPDNKLEKCKYLIADLKGELYKITRCPGDGSLLFDPQHRNKDGAVGFDPLWDLDYCSSEQDVKERMETIAISIIPALKGDNAIWGSSARDLLTGLLTYFFLNPRADSEGRLPKKVSFPLLIRMITEKDIRETVDEVVKNCDLSSTVHTLLSNYPDMALETLTSVNFNMRSVLSKLGTDKDLIYAMEGNPNKFSPPDMLHHSIYVVIPMDRIESYGLMWNILSNLCLKYVMGLPERSEEPDRPYFGFIFDEAGAIYSQTRCSPEILLSALKLIRSKGGVLVVANQNIPSYGAVMDDKQLHDFLSDFQFMLVLDAIDTFSQKEISDLIQKFQKKEISYSGVGAKRKTTTRWTDTPIYEKSDLAALGRSNEMILISSACISDDNAPNPGFATIQKSPYFKDPYFKKLYHAVKKRQLNIEE